MPREIANDTAERSLNVESSSVWQQISQELLVQQRGAEIAQIPAAAAAPAAASGDAGLPKPRELPRPMRTAFPSPYETEKDRWPDFFPPV
ncbi:MAG: hypothetical protein Q8T09_01585 [Candidatus Melainabacteria bacterium]|nr:hypothetical protein [Candidatus Melainabacteria bacterium]